MQRRRRLLLSLPGNCQVDSASTSTGQRAGPNQLGCDVAQLRVSPLRSVGEHGERLILGDLVPLNQYAFGLLDTCARHHDGAQLNETIADPGCCFCIADCDSDPGSDLLGQLNITVVENQCLAGVGVERADGRSLEGQRHR